MEEKTAEQVVRVYTVLLGLFSLGFAVALFILFLAAIAIGAAISGQSVDTTPLLVLAGISLAFLLFGAFVTYSCWKRKPFFKPLIVILSIITILLAGTQTNDALSSKYWLIPWLLVLLFSLVSIYLFGFNKDIKALFAAPSGMAVK